MSTIYVEKEDASGVQLTNTSGADLVQFQFTVLAGMCLAAAEAIASTVIGGFSKLKGTVIQIADYVTSEGTFGTANAPVYWKPTTGTFSNTSTTGYYKIGYVKEIKAGTVTKVIVCDPVLI